MPIAPPPSAAPLESAADSGQGIDPRSLVAAASPGQQPDQQQQDDGSLEALKQMLTMASALADGIPQISQQMRTVRQGLVEAMLALNAGQQQPSGGQMYAS